MRKFKIRENKESPLGVCPKYIFERDRITELCRALYEYSVDNPKLELMELWAEELLERIKNLNVKNR